MTPGPTLDSLIARRLWRAIVLVENGRYQFVEQGTPHLGALARLLDDLDEAQRIVRVLQSRASPHGLAMIRRSTSTAPPSPSTTCLASGATRSPRRCPTRYASPR